MFFVVNSFSQTAAFIWSVADILRGDFKQSQYGRVILPFTLLRRLECVLEPDKEAVQAVFDNLKGTNISATAAEEKLLSATSQNFFNTSPMSLFKLVGEPVLKDSLKNYVQCFSPEAAIFLPLKTL
jgi:type I restriction enzyme M protein